MGVSTQKAQGTRTLDATLYSAGAYQQTTVNTATALTVPDEAVLAIIVCETQAVRYRDDGTNPTATVGMPLPIGMQFIYNGNLSALKFIGQAAGAVINVSYYK
jgi:hypothetical protein